MVMLCDGVAVTGLSLVPWLQLPATALTALSGRP
jgi:hypothetical protein